MTIDDLIARLQEIRKEDGNLTVWAAADEGGYSEVSAVEVLEGAWGNLYVEINAD